MEPNESQEVTGVDQQLDELFDGGDDTESVEAEAEEPKNDEGEGEVEGEVEGESAEVEGEGEAEGESEVDIAEKYRARARAERIQREQRAAAERPEQPQSIPIDALRQAAQQNPLALIDQLGIDREQLAQAIFGLDVQPQQAQQDDPRLDEIRSQVQALAEESRKRDVDLHLADLRAEAMEHAESLPAVAEKLDDAVALALQVQHAHFRRYHQNPGFQRLSHRRALELVEEHYAEEAETWQRIAQKRASVKQGQAKPRTQQRRAKTIMPGKSTLQPARGLSLDEQIAAVFDK